MPTLFEVEPTRPCHLGAEDAATLAHLDEPATAECISRLPVREALRPTQIIAIGHAVQQRSLPVVESAPTFHLSSVATDVLSGKS